jgi:hypothetical protein
LYLIYTIINNLYRKMKLICRYEKPKCVGSQPPPFLAAFLDLLIEFHGEGTMVIVRELLSAPDTHVQLHHEDCAEHLLMFHFL